MRRLAESLTDLNQVLDRIAAQIGRPATTGHIGEYLASRIFDLELNENANERGIDARFRTGELAGRTVQVKFYLSAGYLYGTLADFYLVLTGPREPAVSSRGKSIRLAVSGVYLFDTRKLLDDLKARGVKIGTATSVAQRYWNEAQILPAWPESPLRLSGEQLEPLGSLSGVSPEVT